MTKLICNLQYKYDSIFKAWESVTKSKKMLENLH
jgi:hypothetical protein